MKPPHLHRSLNRGALSPAFTALATRPVSASASIERPHGIGHMWLGVCLVFGKACFELRLPTHRLTPTEAGRNFYERAKRAIEEAYEAELAARGAAVTLSGHLRVCGL